MYADDGSDLILAVCMSEYMDFKGVKRCYESCNMDDPYAPQHFIDVNGVYTFFRFKDRSTPDYSDDGTLEWIEKQNKVTLIKYTGYQQDKRTKYIEKAVDYGCDAIIIIDSDEFLHEEWRDWKTFRELLVKFARAYDPGREGLIFNLYSWIDKDYVKAYNTTEVDEFTLVPRVWHAPHNIEYYNGVHYWVRRKNSTAAGEKLQSTTLTIEHGIRLAQDSKLRDNVFLDARDDWAKAGIKHEDKLIKRYNSAHGLPYRSIYNMVFGDGKESTPKNLNPLVAVTINHYDPQVIDNLKKMINVDKIYLDGFENRVESLNKARDYFLSHEEYSHLIITSDLLNIQRSDINKIIGKLVYFDIVTGWSILKDLRCSFSIDEVHFIPSKRQLNRYNPSAIPNLPFTAYNDVVEIKYTDLLLTGMNRRVVEKNVFETATPDIAFCWDVTHTGYQLMLNPKAYVSTIENPQEIQYNDNPAVLFEKRHVDLDSFMV